MTFDLVKNGPSRESGIPNSQTENFTTGKSNFPVINV